MMKMRNRLRLSNPTFLALAITLLFGTAGETAWEPVGPFGGGVRSLVSDPSNPARMYLGTHTGQIHVTTDGARSWSRVSGFAPPANWVVDDLVVDPQEPHVLYAGMWSLGLGGGGIYKSTDGGESWTELRGMAGQAVRALEMAPSDPRILIAGTRDGVFRSDDAGERWRRISPLGHAEIRTLESVAIDPRDADVVYVGTWHLPWKTTDGGRSWTQIHKGILDDSDVFSLAVNPADPNNLYIGACSGIYRTDSAAAQWRKIQGLPQSSRRTHTLALDPRDAAIVYAGTTEGLWRSPDGGQSWSRLTPQTWVINAVVLDPRDTNHFFLALDSLGVMETRDAGKTFQEANHGFAQRQVSHLVADPSEPGRFYAGLLHDGAHGGVYTTPDGGTSWQQLSTGLGGRDVRSLLLLRQSAMRLLAATPDGVFEYSAERGVWQNQSRWEIPASRPGAPAATVAVWDLFQRSPSEPIHAATSRGLFASRDGRDWKALRLLSNPVSVYGVATLGRDGRTIVAVTADATLISRDAARSWSPLDLGAGPALKVHRVATHAATPDVLFVGTNLGLYRSTDAGHTWERFGRGVPFSPVLDIVISADDPQHVIVGSVGGVFHSLNGGDSFERTGDGAGLDAFPVQSLAFHPQGGSGAAILAASRTNGIFRNGASLPSRPQ